MAGLCLPAVAAPPAPSEPVKAVLLSDIHFDPFHDPAKFAQLESTTVDRWATILSEPDSRTQAADFADLQKTCKAKGVDTPWPLLKASIAKVLATEPAPLFLTVSGDMLAHGFECRYHTLARDSTPEEYSRFAARTVTFVAMELKLAYPKIPVYIALGNNDSGCADYKETPGSMFLVTSGWVAAAAAGQGVNDQIAMEAQHLGDWSVVLPKPLHHTRLIVMQDLFESKKYESCPDSSLTLKPGAAARLQVMWLKQQLEDARAHHQTVWVMGHIPPGVDPYQTIKNGANGCTATGPQPEMFLSDESMLEALTSYADIVRLALFAHTHMDEMRLLTSADGKQSIPMKMVPSISPVNGNNPAFTVAEIDPADATLKDYSVYVATNQAASHWEKPPTWNLEYTYSKTYHQPDYSAASVKTLMGDFLADRAGSSEFSKAYQQHYFAGDLGISASLKAAAMQMLWPTYACAMANPRSADFSACVCGKAAAH